MIGNKEVKPSWLVELGQYVKIVDHPDTDAVYLQLSQESYTADEVLKILDLVADLDPDEFSIEDGTIRLWWD